MPKHSIFPTLMFLGSLNTLQEKYIFMHSQIHVKRSLSYLTINSWKQNVVMNKLLGHGINLNYILPHKVLNVIHLAILLLCKSQSAMVIFKGREERKKK